MSEHYRHLETGSDDTCRVCEEPWPCRGHVADLQAQLAEARAQARENFTLAEQSWCAQEGMRVCRELNEAIWQVIERSGRQGVSITEEVQALVDKIAARDALIERLRGVLVEIRSWQVVGGQVNEYIDRVLETATPPAPGDG